MKEEYGKKKFIREAQTDYIKSLNQDYYIITWQVVETRNHLVVACETAF